MTDTLTPLRVLILEDRSDNAELLVRELRRARFDPDWKQVATEQDFLAHLDPAPDVILSDYFISGFGGLQAACRVGRNEACVRLQAAALGVLERRSFALVRGESEVDEHEQCQQ